MQSLSKVTGTHSPSEKACGGEEEGQCESKDRSHIATVCLEMQQIPWMFPKPA